MTIRHRNLWVTLAAGMALVFTAGCSSDSPTAQPATTAVPSTSAVASTTTARAKPPSLKCPAHAPGAIAKHQRPGTASTFVPGHPTELLACRYHGANQPQPAGSLAKSARFTPGPIVSELNSARRVPTGVAYNCPASFGDTILLIFQYANGSRLTISTPTSGCQFATNGDLSVFTPTATLTTLEAVLGRDHL